MIKNIVDIQNNRIIIKDGFFGIDSTNPRAKLQIGDGNSLSTNPILLQVADTLAVIKDGNRKRVGIGKYPEEDLDIDGNIQISSSGQQKITFYDTGHGHEHGKLLFTDDGNGAKFEIFTKNASSGNVEQTFTINNQGALGFPTHLTYPNFGTPGQIIKSNGTNSVYWDSSPNQDVIWTPYVEPFGLANIGGLVTMDNQKAYYSSFYTSSALRYDKILLYTTEATVNFTGYIGVAIFDSNNSAVGTNKLQEGILQYTNSLSSGQELSIDFSNPVVLNSNSKYWVAIAIDSSSGSLGIAKSSSVNTDNIHIRKESSTNFSTSGFSSVVSTTNSNLNFWYRLYNSQVSTFNDFTDLSTELSLFEVNGTNVVSRFTINNQGAFGIGTNPNFGTPGQILTSQGTNSVTWEDPLHVTWTPYVEPFGLANIGGLVTMDNQKAYYSSFYTSSALRYDKILLYTTEATVNFTGYIGVAIFDSNNSAVGTNKLQEGILQYTNSLSSGQELSIDFSNPVVLNSNSKYWVAIAIDSSSGSLGIAKSSSVNTDNIHIRKESSTNFSTSGFSSVVSTTNSNLNFWYRLYNSQVSTFNDFTDLSTELSLFEVNGTNVVSRFTINNQGAFGIGTNPNFGTPGQILTSQGTNSVTWEDTINYTAGTGVSISPSNVISIGQDVSTTDLVTFKVLELAKDYTGLLIPPAINFSDSLNGGVLATIYMESDGTSGGRLLFSTRDGNLSNERLRINRYGAIGIGGGHYGSPGQVLTSNGSGTAVSWGSGGTTYTAGTGVSISSSNVISIGQAVATSDSVTFNSLNLLKAYTIFPVIDPIINFTDNNNGGTLAQIQMIGDAILGSGQLKFFTKRGGGVLEESLTIRHYGGTVIKTDDVGLAIFSQDGVTEQGYIFHDFYGPKDFTISASSGSVSGTKGIQFKTNSGTTRMRIDFNGNVGIGTTNPSQKLEVNGNIQTSSVYLDNNFSILTFGSSTSYRNAGNNGWSQTPALQIRYSSVECFTLTSDGVLSIRNGLVTGMTTTYSDDRLKHNEVNIINGLEIINQLQPKKYQKTSVALDENYNGDLSGHQWRWEAGLIAQDVEQIDELNFTVLQGGTYEGRYYPYGLSYNNIFVYNIRATQELHELVQQQAQTIANLESRVLALEERISTLENN